MEYLHLGTLLYVTPYTFALLFVHKDFSICCTDISICHDLITARGLEEACLL